MYLCAYVTGSVESTGGIWEFIAKRQQPWTQYTSERLEVEFERPQQQMSEWNGIVHVYISKWINKLMLYQRMVHFSA